MPEVPVQTSVHRGHFGAMRSRTVGTARPGVPEVVFVPGLSVADYLLPSVAVLGRWTRVHLVEIPSAPLSVPDSGRAVAGWLDARADGPVLLCGHSSGAQVVAEAAIGRSDPAGVVLVGPIVDPAYRSLPALAARWLFDGRRETSGLLARQWPEWWQAGPRRLAHLIRVHRRHHIEDAVRRLQVPTLVIRGSEDRLSRPGWARRLAASGHYVEPSGSHSFFWEDPEALSAPIEQFAAAVS